MRIANRGAVVTALALAILLIAACSPDSAQAPQATQAPAIAPTAANPPTGGELFAANCAVCHGANGEGQPNWHIRKENGTLPPPPLNGDGHTWHHADGLLYRIVSQGGKIYESPDNPSFKSAMPAFGDRLSHEEMVEVLTYIKSLWGNKTRMGLSIRESQALVSENDPFPDKGG